MDPRFIIKHQGRDFVLYAGLLQVAHEEGLKRIETRLLQVPSDENGQVAICYAEVETSRGTFTGIGDASPQNVNRMIAPHLIRMSESRAKARALRDAINVAVTAFEELGPDADEPPSHQQPQRVAIPTAQPPKPKAPANGAPARGLRFPSSGAPIRLRQGGIWRSDWSCAAILPSGSTCANELTPQTMNGKQYDRADILKGQVDGGYPFPKEVDHPMCAEHGRAWVKLGRPTLEVLKALAPETVG